MTKVELQAKRAVALSELKDIEVALCLDEHYIDIIEKENAELKESLKKWKDAIYADVENYDDQLIKAKDHIKKLLDCLKQDTNDPQTNYYVCQYMDKAEQFLKEMEK